MPPADILSKLKWDNFDAKQEKMISQGYVDLGLPSGTKWKSLNEGGDNAI